MVESLPSVLGGSRMRGLVLFFFFNLGLLSRWQSVFLAFTTFSGVCSRAQSFVVCLLFILQVLVVVAGLLATCLSNKNSL